MPPEDTEPHVDALEEEAADWVVRQDGQPLGAAEQQTFEAWLNEPGHRAAYERQRAVWHRFAALGAARSDAPAIPPLAVPPIPHVRAAAPRWRRVFAATALAASLVLAFTGYLEDWPTRLRADHATGVGERREVALEDGSMAVLDGASAITFSRTEGQRVVHLLGGAAAFTVAPDPDHPFTVQTEDGSVTALGTAFSVRAEDSDAARLFVSEHSVEVRTANGARAIVREGEGTDFGANGIAPPRQLDTEAATAWTRGKLIVFDRPLGDVVATIARQRHGYWHVRGEAAELRVDGVFDLDHPVEALNSLQKSLDLQAIRLSDRFIILSR